MQACLKTVCLVAILILMSACKPATYKEVNMDDPAMIAAIEDARSTLPKFWEIKSAANIAYSNFGLKVGLATHDNSLEHIWVANIDKSGDSISGTLENTPVDIPNKKYGDRVTFTEDQVTDWQYVYKGKLHGHYTTRIMLLSLDGDEKRQVEALLSETP